jgi:hypothetical protein
MLSDCVFMMFELFDDQNINWFFHFNDALLVA